MWKVVSFAVALSVLFVTIEAQDFCIVCTSSIIHPECINPETADLTNTRCPGPPMERSCYSRVDSEGNVVRGCLGQLDNTTRSDCVSETCQICVGNNMPNGPHGCNREIFPQHRLWCVTCAGGENSNCAGTTNLTMTVCPFFVPDDQCYVARPNGNYERGCMSSSTTRCRDDEACHQCSGLGCNFVDYNSAIIIFSDAKMIGLVLLSIVYSVFNK